MEKTLTIFCDGGARGNPGPAASAFVAQEEDGKEIYKKGLYIGEATNNVAEYAAVLSALAWLKDFGNLDNYSKIVFILDSELVKKQLSGEYKIKNATLAGYAIKIKKILAGISKPIIFLHVLRAKNKDADALVNEALDKALFKNA